MLVELGHLALMLALCLAMMQALVGFWGGQQGLDPLVRSAKSCAYGQFYFLSFALATLINAFLQNDFSVQYVSAHSNSSLPLTFKIGALWGAHEGSLLMWLWLLSIWVCAFTFKSRNLPAQFVAYTLAILAVITAGLMIFMLASSDPFARNLLNYPLDGKDLNPVLQDAGLMIHPPILYFGYVGMALPFAMAISSMLGKAWQERWLLWARPWILLTWASLGSGIVLGSWWAYYELGWGGWWFWDPVENASLLPWLITTALLHATRLSTVIRSCHLWTLCLALTGFSLSLVGTFLVRSGILNSVHAFAVDGSRGRFLLYYIGGILALAWLVFALKSPKDLRLNRLKLSSRASLLLIGSVLLAISAGTLLLGTLFPLIYDALFHEKISVGFPYFNSVILPIWAVMVLVMVVAPMRQWQGDGWYGRITSPKANWAFGLALLAALPLSWLIDQSWHLLVIGGFFLSAVLTITTILTVVERMHAGQKSCATWGMGLAHLGIAIMTAGITLAGQYSQEAELVMSVGQRQNLDGFSIEFNDLKSVDGPNYIGQQADFKVYRENKLLAELKPEKRLYLPQESTMTETAIGAGFLYDLDIAMGDPINSKQWSLRFYVKPGVRWIWGGGLIAALGGVIAALPARKEEEALANNWAFS